VQVAKIGESRRWQCSHKKTPMPVLWHGRGTAAMKIS